MSNMHKYIVTGLFGAAALITVPSPASSAEPQKPAAHDRAPAQDKTDAPTIDTNGDGKPDAWDRNGDGKPDAWDTNGDGKPDVFDNDQDGKPDATDQPPPQTR